MDSNFNSSNTNSKTKKALIIIGVLMSVLIVCAGALYVLGQKELNNQIIVKIDNTQLQRTVTNNGRFVIEYENKYYFNLKQLAKELGYNYYPGKWNTYSEGKEGKESCYITNNKDVAEFSLGNNTVTKRNLLNNNKLAIADTYDIGDKIIIRNNDLYISENGLRYGFNTLIEKHGKTIQIATANYMAEQLQKIVPNAHVYVETDSTLGESELAYYSNQKALLDGFCVIKDPATNLYGVRLSEGKNTEDPIIAARYSELTYLDITKDFLVKTPDNLVGIISIEGKTIIKPEYSQVYSIENKIGLYMVESGGKQGIVNKYGKQIIYQDYDKIGVELPQNSTMLDNPYVLLGNAIPVFKNGKAGLISIEGKELLKLEYDGFGCEEKVKDLPNANPVIVTRNPDFIVVKKMYKSNSNAGITIPKFGLISNNGTIIMNTDLDYVYSITEKNNTKYYISSNNNTADLGDLWERLYGQIKQKDDNSNQVTNQNQVIQNPGNINGAMQNQLIQQGQNQTQQQQPINSNQTYPMNNNQNNQNNQNPAQGQQQVNRPVQQQQQQVQQGQQQQQIQQQNPVQQQSQQSVQQQTQQSGQNKQSVVSKIQSHRE